VRVTVPKGDDPPYVLEGSKIYLRQEAETSLAMRDEIVALIKRAQMASPQQVAALEDALDTAAAKEAAQSLPPPPVQKRSERRRPPRVEVSTRPAPRRRWRVLLRKRKNPHLVLVLSSLCPRSPPDGVEIVASEERQGTIYHTMSDLRDGTSCTTSPVRQRALVELCHRVEGETHL